MRETGEHFATLPVDRSQARPLVCVVGEIYVRWNPYSNRELVRELERLGAEVVVASMAELLYFMNFRMKAVAQVSGRYGDVLRAMLMDAWQTRQERRLHRTVAHLLRRPDESSIHQLAESLAPYYDPALGTEAVLTLGRAIEFARAGADGLVNVLPFSCIPGVITAGMAPRLRRDLDQIPWLDIPFDAQKETNIRTRLEAFMHQVRQFNRGAPDRMTG
jgi:predicted nucleotide-binding protein (sugar kinase/HSP70/actin superfamily)